MSLCSRLRRTVSNQDKVPNASSVGWIMRQHLQGCKQVLVAIGARMYSTSSLSFVSFEPRTGSEREQLPGRIDTFATHLSYYWMHTVARDGHGYSFGHSTCSLHAYSLSTSATETDGKFVLTVTKPLKVCGPAMFEGHFAPCYLYRLVWTKLSCWWPYKMS